MDLWNVNNDTIGQSAAQKTARDQNLELSTLTPMGIRRLSGLDVDVEVVERETGKRYQVTVYESELQDQLQ